MTGLINRSVFVDAASTDDYISDPDDAIFYEVVTEARNSAVSSYLITGNIRHFPVKTFIVTPKEMLDIINQINL